MQRSLATALVLAAAALAGTAHADDITLDNTPFTSTRTRAAVQAELQQFQAAGVNPWSQAYDPLAAFRGERTRADVSAEYQVHRDAAAALNGEDSGSAWLAARGPVTGAPVFAGQPHGAQ